MDKLRLQIIVVKALEQLIKNDRYLIEHDVHEQSISSKLAYYLSSLISPRSKGGWDVDVEYNRNGEIPKAILRKDRRPDIIIHRRGLNNPNGYEENNLLIIQIKKNPPAKDKAKDIETIKAFISEPPFYYCFGVFIGLDRKMPENYKDKWEWFERDISTPVSKKSFQQFKRILQ